MEKEIKSKYYIFMVILCAVFFACGYKIGDSRGFEDGFKEGYTFDCQDEIKALRATHDEIKRAVDVQQKITIQTQNRLDSVAYTEKYGLRDSLLHAKFVIDSVKNWKSAQRYNDSLVRNGLNQARKCPNGEISSTEKLLIASGYKGKFTGFVLGCK